MDAHLDDLLGRFADPPDTPAGVTGPHRFGEIAAEVTALRAAVYSETAPHLLVSPAVVDLDRRFRIDERADHLCAWAADGTLAATLRVTALPLELPELSPRCAELVSGLPGHGEISRVVTDPRHRRPEHITRLFAGMVRAMSHEGATIGVLGVCRRRVARFYARFGMTPVHDDPLALPGRPDDDYLVVAATYEHMVERGMHRLLAGTAPRPDVVRTA